MKYAVALPVLGFTLLLLGWRLGGGAGAWLLAWTGASFGAVGAGYAGLGPRVLGKRPNGTLAWPNVVALLPYFALTWGLWHVQRLLGREPNWAEVAPGLWLGRRPVGAHELPPGVVLVADLTSEFGAARNVRRLAAYRCLPTLDAAPPPDSRAFDDLVRALAASPGPVYVHCALGHGRSALVVAAVLLARGLAKDANEAEAQVKAARPGVGLNKAQRAFLSKWHCVNSTKEPFA